MRKRIVATVFLFLAVSLRAQQPTEQQNGTITLGALYNNIQYSVLKKIWECTGPPGGGPAGILSGTVVDADGNALAGARVLVSLWNGTTFSSVSDETGYYQINDIPKGTYTPVAGAGGYEDVTLGGVFGVTVHADSRTVMNAVLPFEKKTPVPTGENLTIGLTQRVTVSRPVRAAALRRQISFSYAARRDSAEGTQPLIQKNLLTYLYTPKEVKKTEVLPVLLAVYPSEASGWDQASVPLASVGYAVIALGPPYRLDIGRDIDELERIVNFVKAGMIPQCDKMRIAVLGGSYSGIHVLQLLRRRQDFKAAILLGAPSDLFEIRRTMEDKSFIPPYNLDKLMVSLGFPDREPLYYWRYSGAYHVNAKYPKFLIMHSRSDEIVHYHQSEILADYLSLTGVPFEMHLFDNASHYLLSNSGDAPGLLKVAREFLDSNLKDADSDELLQISK